MASCGPVDHEKAAVWYLMQPYTRKNRGPCLPLRLLQIHPATWLNIHSGLLFITVILWATTGRWGYTLRSSTEAKGKRGFTRGHFDKPRVFLTWNVLMRKATSYTPHETMDSLLNQGRKFGDLLSARKKPPIRTKSAHSRFSTSKHADRAVKGRVDPEARRLSSNLPNGTLEPDILALW